MLSYLTSAQQVGFELVTLAGLISGLALGPLIGFFLSLILLPLLLTLLKSVITRNYFSVAPNLNFLSIAVATAIAGLLLGPLGFIIAIVVALALKFVVSNIISYTISQALELVFNTINTIFSLGFLYLVKIANILVLFV